MLAVQDDLTSHVLATASTAELKAQGRCGIKRCRTSPIAWLNHPRKAELIFRSPRDMKIDIAIAPLSEAYWNFLTDKKNKTAINLDDWQAPNSSSVKWGLAAGYPDEHKTHTTVGETEYIANQLITTVAEVSSSLPPRKLITLSSQLKNPHSWYFSGLSGGPLYVVEKPEEREVEDDELFPVGIVFQGFPSTGRPDVPGFATRPQGSISDCHKLSASKAPDPGRHHLRTLGDIISECPGDFVGIRTPPCCNRNLPVMRVGTSRLCQYRSRAMRSAHGRGGRQAQSARPAHYFPGRDPRNRRDVPALWGRHSGAMIWGPRINTARERTFANVWQRRR